MTDLNPSFDDYPSNAPTAAYAHGTESIGDTATLLLATGGDNGGVLVQNNGSVTVYLGGVGVTATGGTAGYALAESSSVLIPTMGGAECELYAITESSTANVAFLYPVG